MSSYEDNRRAILHCCFSQTKDDIIENAVKWIAALKCEPIVVNPAPSPIDPGFYKPFPPITTSPGTAPLDGKTVLCTTTSKDLKNSQNLNIIEGRKD